MNWLYIVAGGIIVFGFLLFIYLATRRRYRDPSSAQNYTKVRNAVTVRDAEQLEIVEEKISENEELINKKEFNFGGLITSFITITVMLAVAFSIFPVLQEQLQSAEMQNVSGANQTLINMVPLFFGLAILIGIISILFGAFRSSGIV